MPDLTGRTLGKYRLVERLGRGGMAEVYRAYQPNLEREVAIKIMHSYLAESQEFLGRFKREAKAVANLHHPHIVQVYDFDIAEDMYYMVMEFIDGETLKERLERLNAQKQRMPLAEAAQVFRALGDALDYAHSQGRIHRDLKPANIMFAGERLVLTDFGLATIVGGTRFTLSGTVIGTPAYMSPEQAQGHAGDERSDIYSLGVILYETVTGRVPFDADTPLAIILKHVNEPLPIPSRIISTLPQPVEQVILKAMAKEPQDRYQTARAMADALEAATSGREAPAGLTPPPLQPTAAEIAPLPAAEIAVGAEPTAKPEAATAPVPAPDDEIIPPPTTSLPTPTITPSTVPEAQVHPKGKRWPRWILWGAGGLIALALVSLFAFVLPNLGDGDGGDGSPGAAVATARPDTNPEALEHFETGLAFLEIGDLEQAAAAFSDAIEADPEFAKAYMLRGVAYREGERPDRAEQDLSRAIELDPYLAEAYYERGVLHLFFSGEGQAALDDLSTAIDLAPDFADAYFHRALLYIWYFDDEDQALMDLDTAIERNSDLAGAWCLRGEILTWQQEFEAALDSLETAVELDPTNARCQSLLGLAYHMVEDYGYAIEHYSAAIDLEPNLDFYYYRAVACLEDGDLEQSLDDFNRVIRLEPGYMGAYFGRGRVHALEGHYEQAIEDLTIAAEDLEKSYQYPFFLDDHPIVDRALVYWETGRPDQAMLDLNAAIAKAPDWYLPYYYRGLIYEEWGEIALARADFERLLELAPDEDWLDEAESALESLEE